MDKNIRKSSPAYMVAAVSFFFFFVFYFVPYLSKMTNGKGEGEKESERERTHCLLVALSARLPSPQVLVCTIALLTGLGLPCMPCRQSLPSGCFSWPLALEVGGSLYDIACAGLQRWKSRLSRRKEMKRKEVGAWEDIADSQQQAKGH